MEAKYGDHLHGLLLAGQVAAYWFEGIKLKLADLTFWTPDYLVMRPDGLLELHECKGFMEDDAAVKLKVAAAQFPFRVLLVKARAKRDGGGWDVRDV